MDANNNLKNYLVITALGEDRAGIVNDLSQAIFQHNGNIIDSRMTVLGGEFAIILMIGGAWDSITKIENALPKLESKLKLKIITKRTGNRTNVAPTLPYIVDVVSLDHPGIVHHLANFFSSRQINIEELSTQSYAAAHTGTPMFSVNLLINIPAETQIAKLREEFFDFCDNLNIDAVIEPRKN